jgi:hypothetical protein
VSEFLTQDTRANLVQAIEWRRKVLEANRDDPSSRQRLADNLTLVIRTALSLGLTGEAAEARREQDALRKSDPDSTALDARLASVLGGEAVPADDPERIRLAVRAYQKSLHTSSAWMYAEAVANKPRFAADHRAHRLYNAACAAALAGVGFALDDPAPDEFAKAKLRAQALGWLRVDLSAWRDVAMRGSSADKQYTAKTLDHWKQDIDLARVRETPRLAEIAEAERKDWEDFWTDVNALRAGVAPK